MDSRLDIVLSANEDGNLVLTDNTNYAEWETDVSNHVAIERLLDYNSNILTTKTTPLMEDTTTEFELISDGMYVYQKLILPTEAHEGEDYCYYEDGKIYLNGKVVEFDVIWKQKSENVNVFWFDDVFFSIFNIVKCFIITENNRLNSIFDNGCKIQCTKNPYAANADFLASAIFVLRYLIKQNNYIEAQTLLNRLQTCSGLCKDVRKSLKECGCGED